MKYHKICPFCNQPFDTDDKTQKFCKRIHYKTCAVCGKKFEVPHNRLGAKDLRTTCSRGCSIQLRKQTNLSRYGGPAPACSKDVQEKMAHTNMERRGVTAPAQSQSVLDKMQKTNEERFGVSWYSQTSDWKIRVESTSEKRYGESWPTRSSEVKEKTISTNLNKFGVRNVVHSEEIKKHLISCRMLDPDKLDVFLKFKQDPRAVIESIGFDHKPTIHELVKHIGVNESTIGVYLSMYSCQDIVNYHISIMEQNVSTFIQSICNTDIKNNVHNMITPYELDIYIPEHMFAIECNPTATHNSSIPDPWGCEPKSPSYHKMKTDMCEEKGIFLFHIFGYEWTHKREIIESMIKNILGKCDQKIYARKCVVKEVDSNTATKFLNGNHRQGAAGASVRLGLYYQGELVSLMTFGKVRNTIGTSKNEDLSDCWELVRFCSKLNTSVVGGASKLFQYFVREYTPARIRSFSDRAHTRGTLYQKLGFTELRRSDPGYVWVDLYTDRAYNRYNTQKQNIRKFLHDDTLDLSKSEKQIMEEHDFVQVFDCGTITWEYV